MASSLTLQEIPSHDLRDLVRVHRAAFPEAALTRLGAGAVRRYYETYLSAGGQSSPSEAKFAVGAYEDVRLVGYCVCGLFPGAQQRFMWRHGGYLALRSLLNPGLFFNSRFLARVRLGAQSLFGHAPRQAQSRTVADQSPTTQEGAFRVLAIAVDPAAQGRGVGHALMEWAHEAAQRAGFGSVGLTVHADNDTARRLYERLGYEPVTHRGEWSGGMIKRFDPS